MKMVRTACVFAALLVLTGWALRAQEPLFGSDPAPKSSSQSTKVSPTNGTWKILISRKGTTRLIRIVGWGPEKNIKAVDLECSQDVKAMQNVAWVIARGECLLKFKPDGGIGSAPLKFMVEAAALESSRLGSSASEDQLAKADQNPVRVTITLAGVQASGSDAGSSPKSGSALADQLRPALLIFCIALVVAIIILLLFLKYKNPKPAATGRTGKDEFDEDDTNRSPRQTRSDSPPIGKAPIQDVLRQKERSLNVEPFVQETSVEKTLREHAKLLLALSSKDQDLETQISEVAEQCVSMLSQSTRQANESQSEIRNDTSQRMYEVENRIGTVQGQLTEHLASQSSRLQDLFRDLPALSELSKTARVIDKSELSRLEDNLVSAARHSALPSEKLEALRDQSSGLLDAIQEFARTAQSFGRDHAKKRLTRVIESATVVNHELVNLGQLAATQKHGFFVEMSLLEQNPLAKDLATALTRETTKLGDPEGYYLKKLEALRAHACVAGIDLADLDIDAERRNAGLQQALAKLLQTLGMTPIDPRQNDKLQAAEHQVVQFVRRVPGVQPGAIAHTMARGLQRGGEVVRKASVLLYE
jgi:ElaB/YqjD/DUF883 family membrane-anchored ribosome-binding protein